MNADRHLMFADVSLFEVANAPTNMYDYLIPKIKVTLSHSRKIKLQKMCMGFFVERALYVMRRHVLRVLPRSIVRH